MGEGEACPKYSTITDSREVEDGVERRDRWYTVTKQWSSRVQQEHRNKSQDCVTARLD